MKHHRCGPGVVCLLIFMAATALAGPKKPPRTMPTELDRDPEVQYSSDEYRLLDTFEGHRLTKADEVFGQGDYRRAYSEYDAFILEFPKSKALPYALFRKAHSLHRANKRFEAIKAYSEVLDYFPNAVRYAAPALFMIGKCEWQNGNNEKALKAWIELADDGDYNKHPFAATAINLLAQELWKDEKYEQAVKYNEHVARTFRTQNPDSASLAIGRVVEYYIRHKPDEPKLRAFYQDVKGFGSRPDAVPADLLTDRQYWGHLLRGVKALGKFAQNETSLRRNYYDYWSRALDGKFAGDDDYAIEVAGIFLLMDGDLKKWMERLDAQFTKYQKADDLGRVIRWISLYGEHKNKALEYYNKLDFAKMNVKQKSALVRVLYDDMNNPAMGRNAFLKIPMGELSDADKGGWVKFFSRRDEPALIVDLCMTMQDKDLGRMTLLQFYVGAREYAKALPLADEVAKVPQYSEEALEIKGGIFEALKQYEKAIAVYQQLNNPPKNLWKIADCYVRLGKIDSAIQQLREVENFFKSHSAEAALRIARVYRGAGRSKEEVASLRGVMKKYPKSPQSTTAHQDLEGLGVRIGGGVDAE